METASLLPDASAELSAYLKERTRPAQSRADTGQLVCAQTDAIATAIGRPGHARSMLSMWKGLA